MKCTHCAFENPSVMRFCGNCGAALEAPAQAERRQVTVMFCDLVDSTPLSGQLDPEDLREVLGEYQATARAVIDRYGGHIAQYLGDGILAYFGYPEAHEDDASRAVDAGLDLLAQIVQVNERIANLNVTVAARIGIETGPVVTASVGGGGTRERLALGETPNVAARLQSLAGPGELVLGERTAALVRDRFELESCGVRRLKGIDRSVQSYRAVGRRLIDVMDADAGPPLVGRAAEIEALRGSFRRTVAGHGTAVLILGEPGIGKSRLLLALRDSAVGSALWLAGACSPIAQNTPLHPFVQLLSRAFGFRYDDSAEDKARKLSAGLTDFGDQREAALPLLGAVVGVAVGEAPALSPELARERTIDALLDYIAMRSRAQPVVVSLEDLHWADSTTMYAVGRLAARARELPLLLVATSRPPLNAAWAERVLTLERVPDREVEAIARRVLGGRPLDPRVLALLVERTDGVPLFVEELAREMQESGAIVERDRVIVFAEREASLNIPATLQSSLVARIDRLGDAKRIMLLAAVFGREFRQDALARIAELDAATVAERLDRLVGSGLLLRMGDRSAPVHAFKHVLIQEAAYGMLLHRDRRDHHLRIAQVFERDFVSEANRHPEMLAHHYTEAGVAPEAIRCWVSAGQLALGSSAADEANAHVARGLRVLDGLPESAQRDAMEIQLRLLQGTALRTAKGFTDPNVVAPYERAVALSRHRGNLETQVWAMLGVRLYYIVRGELAAALKLDDELLQLAQASGEPALVAIARMNLASSLVFHGRFAEALPLVEQAMAIDSDAVDGLRMVFGFDLHIQSGAIASICLWHLGRSNDARQFSRRVVERIEAVSHGFSAASGYVFAGAQLHHFMRDAPAVAGFAARIIAVCEAHGYPSWLVQGTMFTGWARAALATADAREAVRACCNEIDAKRAREDLLANSYFYGLAADAWLLLDDVPSARRALADAFDALQRTGDQMWQAELHRLEGDVACRLGDVEAAERHYSRAIATAERQQSRALLLRATVSLARHLRALGRGDEALRRLRPIVAELAACHDTIDLHEAQELLAAAT